MWCHLKIFFTSFYLFSCFFVSLYMICVSVQLLSISLDHFQLFFLNFPVFLVSSPFNTNICFSIYNNNHYVWKWTKRECVFEFLRLCFLSKYWIRQFFSVGLGFLYFEMYLKMFEERLQMYRKCVSIFVFKSIWQVIRVQWPEGLHGVSHFFGWGF